MTREMRQKLLELKARVGHMKQCHDDVKEIPVSVDMLDTLFTCDAMLFAAVLAAHGYFARCATQFLNEGRDPSGYLVVGGEHLDKMSDLAGAAILNVLNYLQPSG